MRLLKFVKTFEQQEREQSEHGRNILARRLLSGKFDGAVMAVRDSKTGQWESYVCNASPQEILYASRLLNVAHVDSKCFHSVSHPWLRDDDVD